MTHTPPWQLRVSAASTAVVLGLGGMVGAGVFAGLAPAASAAGGWFLAGAALAALAALCAASSAFQRARGYPDGDYACVREQLGIWPARMAGSAHLVGRVAAVAALAGTFGRYVVPGHALLASGVLVVLATVVVARGFDGWGTLSARVLVLGALVVLALVAAACFGVAPPPVVAAPVPPGLPGADTPGGIFAAAGVMFFAFTGFDRMTVAAASRTTRLPRAVPFVVAVALVAYLAVGAGVYRQLGAARLALSPTPLLDAVVASDAAALAPLVRLGAAITTVPVLLLVLARTGPVLESMAELGDLPAALSRQGRTGTPALAGVVAGVGGLAATLLLSPAAAVSLAACCALFACAFSHAATRVLLTDGGPWPMRAACFGIGLSVVLAMSMPIIDLAVAALAMAAGAGLGALVSRRWR